MVTAISYDPRQNLNVRNDHHQQNGVVVLEEIEGLIKFYNNGHIERPQIVPTVPPYSLPQELGVTAKDVILHNPTNLWSRIYLPNTLIPAKKLPLLVYFHGGGFCVGSAAWKCYHDFLANLTSKIGCVIMSVNYRLAPENRLPAAYDDGVHAITWLKNQALANSKEHNWWSSKCSFSNLFLSGDSAGANIAYHVATRLNSYNLKPLSLKGLILIQPFFGGESRIHSEKYSVQPPYSALNLPASDTYWRLALPVASNRDHPWCKPRLSYNIRLPSTLVCISETDLLKDRNLELCSALADAGIKVEKQVYKGVGHAFQILHNSPRSQPRTHDMTSHLKNFIHDHY
ncbi:putative carboxylesterase 17 [Nicotiana tabacum]|uniref:Carboxylesterase 17 n=1 Tax=Nicotiana tabacum TaxID=4097 RepID=A0A1S4ADP4_TOBAC|nr:PREDICTED: probable carboxylesterase 17 [Nicotiana tabacum]